MAATPLEPSRAAVLTRRITLASVAMAAILIVVKFLAWRASTSTAMLASMADSGLDLIASLATFAAVRYAAVPPDAEHSFGHGKAEAFASLMQAGLVFASAALIAREAATDLANPHPLHAEGLAVGVMALSTVLTFALITAQSWVLRKTSSVAVAGDRAHYASDLASNLIALAGIAASAILGLNGLDAMAAIGVAALLLWGAVSVFRQAAAQLMDRELPDEDRANIVELATADGRLSGVHQLRTRASGPYVHMQMHVDLDPDLSLAAAHAAMVAAEKRILSAYPHADILMHPDPHGQAEPHGGAFSEAESSSR